MPVTEERGTTAVMDESCFSPTILHVGVGELVTWTNKSTQPHTVTGANASWGDYAEFKAGDSVEHRFDTAGIYPYYCFVHPGMIGAIVVGDAASSGDLSSAAVQAVRPSTGGNRAASDVPARVVTESGERAMWPLVIGGALGVAGLTAGAGVATFAVSRRR